MFLLSDARVMSVRERVGTGEMTGAETVEGTEVVFMQYLSVQAPVGRGVGEG